MLFVHSAGGHPDLHSFPTRRSSDLPPVVEGVLRGQAHRFPAGFHRFVVAAHLPERTTKNHVRKRICGFELNSPSQVGDRRSEERRVGKESRSRWSGTHCRNNDTSIV